MTLKGAISTISLLLVVGAIVGIIAVISNQKHTAGKVNLSTGMKSIEVICASTEHKQLCVDTLTPSPNNGSLSIKDFLEQYHKAILQDVKAAFSKATSMGKHVNRSYDKTSAEECQKLLTYAIHDLQKAISEVSQREMGHLNELTADLNNCLSAVLSHKLFCLEPLRNPELITAMNEVLVKTELQVANALCIVDEVDKMLGNVNSVITSQNPRHLLGVKDDGFPTWLADDDRRVLEMENNQITPDVVVAQDGSGQYRSIAEALAAFSTKKGRGRYIIYVKTGVYQEYTEVLADMGYVFMYGDGKSKTIITGDKNVKRLKRETGDGSAGQTATFVASGYSFMAKSMGFHNTAGPLGDQAVALRVLSDNSVFYDCAMDGYQDTLLIEAYRQFYHRCVISGTVDFMFGFGTAVIKDSDIIVRLPNNGQFNAITADGRTHPRANTGISIQGCRIMAEDQLEQQKSTTQSYLGRPWKQHARTMVMESEIGDFINPEGWHVWNDITNYQETCEYREYANRGPGADVRGRVKWGGFKVVTDETEARQYKPAEFLKPIKHKHAKS